MKLTTNKSVSVFCLSSTKISHVWLSVPHLVLHQLSTVLNNFPKQQISVGLDLLFYSYKEDVFLVIPSDHPSCSPKMLDTDQKSKARQQSCSMEQDTTAH